LPLVTPQKLLKSFDLNILKRHTLLKIVSLNALSVGAQFVLGIFSVRIVSEFLGPNGMALTGNFRSFTSLFKSVSVMGLKEGLINLITTTADKKEKDNILFTFLSFFLMIAIGLAIIIIAFSEPMSIYLFKTAAYANYLVYFAALLPFFVLQTVLVSLLNALQQFKKIIGIQIVTNFVLFLASFYLIYQELLAGAFLSIAITDLIGGVVVLFFAKKHFTLSFHFQSSAIKTISKFIIMALVSAIVIPLTAILLRNHIIDEANLSSAGIWEATSRVSSFYMLFFSTGLSLYYLPKLGMLQTAAEFKEELAYYFKTIVPLFVGVGILVYLFKDVIISIALTSEFTPVRKLLVWQLVGDLIRIMTLAFGFQILAKAMVYKYIFIELLFNGLYLLFGFLLFESQKVEGIVQAYAIANGITLLVILFLFRKLWLRPTI
jgi:PST family polysaccharide transporter